MNVKELKQILKSLSDDAEIYIDSLEPHIEGNEWWFKVKKIGLGKTYSIRDNKVAQRPCKETAGCERGLVLFYD